jgi:hypothetical protein
MTAQSGSVLRVWRSLPAAILLGMNWYYIRLAVAATGLVMLAFGIFDEARPALIYLAVAVLVSALFLESKRSPPA